MEEKPPVKVEGVRPLLPSGQSEPPALPPPGSAAGTSPDPSVEEGKAVHAEGTAQAETAELQGEQHEQEKPVATVCSWQCHATNDRQNGATSH